MSSFYQPWLVRLCRGLLYYPVTWALHKKGNEINEDPYLTNQDFQRFTSCHNGLMIAAQILTIEDLEA